MVIVRTVYSDGTEGRLTYKSYKGDTHALAYAVRDVDTFQMWKHQPLASIAANIDAHMSLFEGLEVQS